jgi:nanoRNase/pAp phosphatase (c-di-AMP/oligoRNAs hydrolase)
VDKADSAQFNREDVLEPKGWELMSFLMDARTGLGRFHEFRISNYQLMMQLIDYCLTHKVEEALELPDVKERVDLYFSSQEKFVEQLKRCTTIHGNLAVIDLRNEETIWPGNRFMVYALHPECNLSMHVLWGLKRQNTVFAIGNSILNRTSPVNIGELCLSHGGGGHANAGTIQVDNERAEEMLRHLIAQIGAIAMATV